MNSFLRKTAIVLCIAFPFTEVFSQKASPKEKLVNIWEYRGGRKANSNENFSETYQKGMYKIFFDNGTFKNIMFRQPHSVTTTQGAYQVVNDSVIKEILNKTQFDALQKVNELKYRFESSRKLFITFKLPNGFEIEEKWIAVDFLGQPEDDFKWVDKKDLALFSDPMLLKINPKASDKEINAIKNPAIKNLAQQLKKQSYATNYRVAEFHAKLSPTALGEKLSIGDGYSRFEQVTGMYLPEGENVIVLNNLPEGKHINILIPDWERRAPEGVVPDKDPNGWGLKRKTYALTNGANIINVEKGGLVYVDYFSEKPENEPVIKMHFISGKVNGFFDLAKHSNKDWNSLLDNAIYPIMDAIGNHIQIAYPVESCKKYAYGKGVELIKNYDLLVKRQYEIMGLEKYNRVPKNRILSRVNYNYYMFRDADGVAYMGTNPGYAMAMVTKPESVIKGDPCWGFSHEVGHVHQLRPFLNWGGTHEVSNNIYTLYVTTSFGNKSRLAEQNNYEKARKSIIEKKISYLQDPDVFNRLVPFWQLQLYFKGVGNQPDFYPDLFEELRKQAENAKDKSKVANPGVWQMNFIITACDVSKTDLTDFFEKYGFFYVGEFSIQDYGTYQYDLPEDVAKKVKEYVKSKKYPQPKIDISTLTDDNWKSFK